MKNFGMSLDEAFHALNSSKVLDENFQQEVEDVIEDEQLEDSREKCDECDHAEELHEDATDHAEEQDETRVDRYMVTVRAFCQQIAKMTRDEIDACEEDYDFEHAAPEGEGEEMIAKAFKDRRAELDKEEDHKEDQE